MVYEKIPPFLFECSVNASSQDDLIQPRLVLEIYGFKQNDICETFENNLWSLKVFSENKKIIDDLKQSLQFSKISGIKVLNKILKPNQWLTRWKNHWKPLSLTKTIDVIPAWYKNR